MKMTEDSNFLYEVPLPPEVGMEAIYCITDPETAEIRYVGKSNYPPRRFADHISIARKLRSRGRTLDVDSPRFSIYDWIAMILDQGKHPKMFVLSLVPAQEAVRAEREWIEKLKKDGAPLLNDGETLRRYSIDDMHALARLAGGACVSSEYLGIAMPLFWRCSSCEKLFSKTPYRVMHGGWCNPCLRDERHVLGISSKELFLARKKSIQQSFHII
jgi:hypothetical protein